MSYLIDTDIVVGWLKGRDKETSLLRSISHDGLTISLITYGEIFEGIYFGRNPEANEEVFRQFLRWVDVLPLNRPIMRQFARIRGQLRQSGQMIGDSDILIGATALHHNRTLVTHNTRHFSRIPELTLYQSN